MCHILKKPWYLFIFQRFTFMSKMIFFEIWSFIDTNAWQYISYSYSVFEIYSWAIFKLFCIFLLDSRRVQISGNSKFCAGNSNFGKLKNLRGKFKFGHWSTGCGRLRGEVPSQLGSVPSELLQVYEKSDQEVGRRKAALPRIQTSRYGRKIWISRALLHVYIFH
jgi:hypothetical protein